MNIKIIIGTKHIGGNIIEVLTACHTTLNPYKLTFVGVLV